jgi:hypothetical protein
MRPDPDLDEFPFDPEVRFSADDDRLHQWQPHADWVETTWFSFNVPARALAGWLYVQLRPNLGTAAGGAFVYDPTAHLAWELPYYAYFHHHPLPVPADKLDLTDVTFRNGVSIRRIEPGSVYELGYRFRDHDEFTADLRFEGLTPPVPHLHGAPPFTGSSHYDQHGHVTGELRLHGETIPVDCYAVRDRSWGRRPERIGASVRRLSYVFGTFGTDDAFLAFCMPPVDEPHSAVEHLSTGYLLRDGRLRRLASATRATTRDPATGGIATIELDMTDTDGRRLDVKGNAASRMFLNHGGLCINTLLRFTSQHDELGEGWGEDQDVFSLSRFAAMRRENRPR